MCVRDNTSMYTCLWLLMPSCMQERTASGCRKSVSTQPCSYTNLEVLLTQHTYCIQVTVYTIGLCVCVPTSQLPTQAMVTVPVLRCFYIARRKHPKVVPREIHLFVAVFTILPASTASNTPKQDKDTLLRTIAT